MMNLPLVLPLFLWLVWCPQSLWAAWSTRRPTTTTTTTTFPWTTAHAVPQPRCWSFASRTTHTRYSATAVGSVRRKEQEITIGDNSCDFGKDDRHPFLGRRQVLSLSLASFLSAATVSSLFPQKSHASLLDEYGYNPSKIEVVAPKQVASAVAASSSSSSARTEIDPSLRASYYYPTAKKRYLPRIQKVTSEMEACTDALVVEDWEAVQSFSRTAENAILPLQLYVSSLDGQGLSMSTGFAKEMRQNAVEYEKAYRRFDQALQKRDSSTALQAVSDMGMAVTNYRLAGRLKDDDGNIPSIDEMKRMAMRRPTVAIASMSSPTR